MILDAMDKIEQLVKAAHPEFIEIKGLPYMLGYDGLQPVISTGPKTISLHTLDGLVDFINEFVKDPISGDELTVTIEDFKTVSVSGKVVPTNHFYRFNYVVSSAEKQRFEFATNSVHGGWYSLEDFVIALMTNFEQTDVTKNLLEILGNVKETAVINHVDDGASQSVNTSAGIDRVLTKKVPNPVKLRPFRTFLEIEQPESLFVCRLKSGAKNGEMPTVALFEADGGLWKMDAISKISAYLAPALPTNVPIIK